MDLSVAPQVAARRIRAVRGGITRTRGASAGGGGTPGGVPILNQQFPGQLYMVVEIAWGATVTANMSTWTWTDVTADVLYNSAVSVTPGRQDESSTPSPAQCQLTLRNSSGAYSKGGQSPNYPNVNRGVPLRVRVVYNGASNTRFLGYVASFTPGWDTTGRFATVAVVAAGTKRRFAQNQLIEASTLTRTLPTGNPLAYWPLEDGVSALAGAAAAGSSPLRAIDNSGGSGTIAWASDTSFVGTLQSPVLKGGEAFVGGISGATSAWTVVWGQNVDPTTGAQVFFYSPTFTLEVLTYTDQSVDVIVTPTGSVTGTTIISIGPVGVVSTWLWYVISCQQSGGNVTVTLAVNGGNISATLSSTTLGGVSSLLMASPVATTGPTGFSQVAVYGSYWTSLPAAVVGRFVGPNGYNAFAGEYVQDRMVRLASEDGEFLTVSSGHRYQLCGAQDQDTFINLMESAAAVDQGVLYDGFAQGLSYASQDEITSQPPTLNLDASLGQLVDNVSPVDDDQYTVNEFTVSRTNGSSLTYTDTRSNQNPNAIGTYDGSDSINAFSDTQQLLDYAAWRVNLGTFDKYRYPSVEMWLHRNPELLSEWLNSTIGCRIDIINLVSVRTQVMNATITQLMQGYTETIDQFTWSIVANCTPYDPWKVGEWSQPSGDTNSFVLRLDTDGSTTVALINPGDATCSVSSNVGVPWTTNSDDFPINLVIGGYLVAVTSISGATSPQTFNLSWYTPLPTRPIPAGSAVNIFDATVFDVLAM